VLAEVTQLHGLSGHADADELMRWLSSIETRPRQTFVTHGEDEAAEAFAARLARERSWATHVPHLGETVLLD